MKIKKIAVIIASFIIAVLYQSIAIAAIDAPHNASNNISCGSCHGAALLNSPFWGGSGSYDQLCLNCHRASSGPYTDTNAPLQKTHSSLSTDNGYGDWTRECRNCHDPHYQKQKNYKATESGNLYLATGTITSCVYNGNGTSTLTYSIITYKSGWDAVKLTEKTGEYRRAILFPNVNKLGYSYPVIGVDIITKKITVTGNATAYLYPPTTFAVMYGQYIKDFMDVSGTNTAVKFFDKAGAKSFADGDSTYNGVCEICHTKTTYHRNNGSGTSHYPTNNCSTCHSHTDGFAHGGGGGESCGTSTTCHGTRESHTTHVSGVILSLDCSACHNTSNFPQFKDGESSIATTGVCNNCHSADGVANARAYWDHPGSSSGTAGSWGVVLGEKSFCGSCHDSTPGNSKGDGTGDNAFNVIGNDSTYGFYVTGHGRVSGNYARLSYQDTSATGNPAANKQCNGCHNLQTTHYNNAQKRLKAGYENNQSNNNCNQCHPPGTVATGNPQFYTNSTDYENSAHKGKLCTECHDVHGTVSGAYNGMTKANQESLCYTSGCHAGIGGHPGVGSKSFTHNSKNYTLECVSCHNVHIVTGTYAQANQNKSPVTRFADNTNVWGDVAGEKMNAYAGSGTYRTPKGELFTGAQLPDYPTFCLDCHGSSGGGSVYFGINWDGDNHGRISANQPNGYGTCPNWFACGKAFNWDNADCVATDKNDCWPVIPRGAGDQLWSREPYTHTERNAGANFTLSCTDCHTGHGTGTLGRPNVNGGSFTSNWNNMCNYCHYYYSDWHAGMGCGNASCHVSDRMNQTGTVTLHAMSHQSGSGGTRTFNPDQVLWYRFENNLNDSSSTWQMDGKWYSTSGSFTTGKSGQAVVLGEGIGVQVGTENSYWSTDAGYHGTWVYTEMKFNTSLEAWVYPTDNAKGEYTIFIKHVGVSNNGGYAFTLKKINGTLRAAFNMAADNNGVTQDGRAGVRGAYSSIAVPLNTWTHVAATFDTGGPDRNLSDPSVGRVRIYVNGVDVTTSDSSGTNMQPGVNETSIYAYSENEGWNDVTDNGPCDIDNRIGYTTFWCASEFAIGGFDWQTTNFIGRIDEAKVWNVTKNAEYFSLYASQTAPYISFVEGIAGNTELTVTFSKGVYTNTGSSGALVPGDFTLTDTNGDNPRTITGVTHTAGASTATITMSQPLKVDDVNVDTIAAASNAIYDEYNNAAGTEAVTISLSSQCPSASPVSIQLNESTGSAYIMDTQNILYGAVNGSGTLTGSAYSGGGDGSGRYIDFEYNNSCLLASTAMTLEARIKPTGLPGGSTDYIRRVLDRTGGGNYQLSVWRDMANTFFPGFTPPDYVASIALWVRVVYDPEGDNYWKPVLTDYTICPIVSDHWYQVKAVWNTNKGGTPGQFFVPADIYVDDQGTDGNGAGESWSGYANCTNASQSYQVDSRKLYTGDSILAGSGNFVIGANSTNHANNLFNGLIDWITWKDTID